MSCNKLGSTLLIKKPTRLNKAIISLPSLKEAEVNFGLPRWKSLSLDAKIPVIPSPEKAYTLFRQKLGRQLRTTLPFASFDLSEVHNRELDNSYNALHDKHLNNFFSRPNNKKHLIKKGLVNNKLEVVCSPKEYNDQRQYWRKLQAKVIQEELKKKDKLDLEKKILEYSDKLAEKDATKLLAEERRKKAQTMRKLNETNRLKTLLNKEEEREKKLKEFWLRKRNEFLSRKSNGEKKIGQIQKTKELANRIERCRLLMILRTRAAKEREKKKIREMKLEDEQRNKIMKLNERWKKKEEIQIKSIDREQALLACAQKQREKNIEKYNEKIKKQREIDEQFFSLLKKSKKTKLKSKEKSRIQLDSLISKSIKSGKSCASRKKVQKEKPQSKLKSKSKSNVDKKVKSNDTKPPKILQLFSIIKDQEEKKCGCLKPKK